VLRFLKYSSVAELSEKLLHLGFPSTDVANFMKDGVQSVFIGRASLAFSMDDALLRENGIRMIRRGEIAVFSVPWSFLRSRESIEEFREKVGVSGKEVVSALERFSIPKKRMVFRGRVLNLEEAPFLMGIVNVTPDSFSDGGKFFGREVAVERALALAEQGAHIIDIGGESTRPGADPVDEKEELERVIPVVEELARRSDVLISVDTYKSSVARAALEAGAHVVNDISGLRFSPDMADVVAEYGAGVVIMHIKGTPRDMQKDPRYRSLPDEIMDYLSEGVSIAREAGVCDESIVIDPGIGFGKRYEDNLYILKNMEEFKSLGYPVLIGTSRKSFIGRATGKDVSDREFGTAATVAIAVLLGADIVRVHDVAGMRDVVAVAREIRRCPPC